MFGQPFVHKCVVGRQQFEDAAVLAEDTFEEEFSLALKCLA